MKRFAIVALAAATLGIAPAAAQQPAPAPYQIGVVSESGDIVTWLAVRDGRLVQERVVPVGLMPADVDGPHNIAVAPDHGSYYVTIAHGTPFGSLWRLDAKTDTLIGRADVEFFPTTIGLTPDGEFAFVANSDFHGDRPRVNPVSVIHTPTMSKIADIPVCDMPHGVKSNRAGTRVYVSCMHSDEIVEMDVSTIGIARRAKTGAGHEMATAAKPGQEHAGHATAPTPAAPAPEGTVCSPTFVAVSPDDRFLYVACNTSNDLQLWDAKTLTKVKAIHVGKGAYNVEPSPDGKWVLVTNKKDRSVSLVDAASFTEVARIPTTKGVVHGVAYSPDGQYAFVSAESVGSDPGSVDMIDLATRKLVSTFPVPAQPTGIAIWRR